tara:strand:- start:5189 stop:6028 length:840 start_codon:yes stop_codon:yes gene_type:complete
MAKKKEKKVEVETPQVEETVIMEKPVVKPPVMEKVKSKKDEWEIKDRVYYLTKERRPLSYIVRSTNIYYFDEKLGYERELKYCENQRTPFVDEMQGDQRLSHVIFRSGALFVPKNKQTLQKLLSLYHPHKDKLYYEWKPEATAAQDIDILEKQVDALIAAKNIDIDTAEAIMRVEVGSEVNNMGSKEIKRDLLLFAKRNPLLFLELVSDENVQLRNFGIKATEMGIINLSHNQRTFSWGSTGRKLMTVPFDEHPYTALAHWFKTDEGMEIYSNIQKRLK